MDVASAAGRTGGREKGGGPFVIIPYGDPRPAAPISPIGHPLRQVVVVCFHGEINLSLPTEDIHLRVHRAPRMTADGNDPFQSKGGVELLVKRF